MNKSFIIKGTIYPYDVCISYSNTEDARTFFKYLCKEEDHKYTENLINGDYVARTVKCKAGKILVHLNSEEEIDNLQGLIAHEMFHVVDIVFRHIGVSLCNKSSENYAYYLDYLVSEIDKNIKEF